MEQLLEALLIQVLAVHAERPLGRDTPVVAAGGMSNRTAKAALQAEIDVLQAELRRVRLQRVKVGTQDTGRGWPSAEVGTTVWSSSMSRSTSSLN